MPFSRVRIKSRPDLLSGLLFIGLGLLGLAEAVQYDLGTARRMGAGFFPVILSLILAGLGVATALTSLSLGDAAERAGTPAVEEAEEADDEEEAESADPWPAIKAALFVVAALVVFAVSLRRVGLVIAVALLVVISSFADRTLSWRATAVIAAFMAFVAVAVFRWGIGLPLPVWP